MPSDLARTVLEACEEHRERVALLDALARPVRFSALRSRVLAVAAGLRARGLEPGDRVLFAVSPSPTSLTLALGVVTAGGTLAFADPRAGEAVLRARAAALAPRWAIAASPVHTLAGRPWRALPGVTHVHVGPRLPGVPRGSVSWRRLCQRGGHADVRCQESPHDHRPVGDPAAPALVIPTSGTTAEPRLVVHSRAGLGTGLAAFAARVPFAPGDVVHTDQLMIGLPALAAGATWSLPGLGARATRLGRVLRRRGATHTFCVPADVEDVVRGGLPPGLRGVLLGAAPVLPGPLRRLRAAAPDAELLAIYGMTELAPAAIATAEEKIEHTESGAPGDLLGTPLRGVEVRVVDDELRLTAPHQALGYLGADVQEIPTGDLGHVLDDGRVVLTGRRKDMIIRGDRNIYPGLYEAAVADLPGVREALLVGVPTPAGDEHVVLAVAGTAPGPATVRRLFGVDAPDEVVVLDELPRGGRSRKPDRAALRAQLAAR
ncbi:acyl-CoA synthetase (AMP-forming)/AMP-acid ligase II [Actinomycetospora succinea]|uniref:Acyl-CoA synthetase (AMP-forming)/AMP-acid ligase II n=1 Tax=Actinomycetospora succinea TaxID=663603 RepID=A0A4R6VMD3_9PSEU|nr:class I adenylate-forming enzyme family protein [Actinomycetospora succinea]TDQ64962.1 acyl-CoA synthetase (AMP-forming)/AMP-acid ligase II [Actinomycetospora succinea]